MDKSPMPSLLPLFRSQQQAELLALILADAAGLVSSPYFAGLSDVLVRAFGVPWVIGQELARVDGIDAAFVYGSWAARFSGEDGDRPVGDIDLLVLGGPDRGEVYAAASAAEHRLGRAVQVTIRSADC